MMNEKIIHTRKVFLFGILGFVFLVFAPALNAEPLAPIAGEFTAVFNGVDPETGEFLFEGSTCCELPGDLSIRMVITRQTGVGLHFWASWTITTSWDETISGENTGLLSTASLHFREHGVIVDATGSLTELIGNFIVIHGEISDLNFIPEMTEVTGQTTIVPSQAD